MNVGRSWKFVYIIILLASTTGCGRIWGTVAWLNQNPGSLAYSCSTQVFLRSTPNTPNGPTTSTNGVSYSVSSPLPAGLSLNSSTGVISGTPTVITAMTAYTITETSSSGATATIVNIRTADGILVNDLTHDAHNAAPGICSSVGFGTCTLRAAIEESISSGPSVILIPSGTNTLSLGQLSLTNSMDIYGNCSAGSTVDANHTSGVFSITAAPTSLNNLDIKNGQPIAGNSGGGILINLAGAGTVTLNNDIIEGNSISGNSVNGAGIEADAVGVLNLVIQNSTIQNNSNNSAAGFPQGGGVNIEGGNNATITNSTFFNNSISRAGESGGAIYFFGNTLIISGSLFYNNSSSNAGGSTGGAVGTNNGSGTVTISNSTFVGNMANKGAAIGTLSTNMSITNCTFTGNTVNIGGPFGAAIELVNNTAITLSNNIFYNNLNSGSAFNCFNEGGGSFTSSGNNLSDTPSGDCNTVHAGDINGTSALLGPLQNNGGPTMTLAELSGSPSIDQGSAIQCPSVDQRGYARLTDGKCDIGSYEVQP